MIDIVKASAGSGKTFTLAKKYISLLMNSEDRHAYRHILAVTFTNKATDEMKNRILQELHILSTRPEESGYCTDLQKIIPSLPDIKKKAGDVLTDILHDYGAFSISTIDRFFQRTLKAFVREAGQFPSYKVELDKESLVNECVDRILDALDDNNKPLLNWLTDSAKDSISKGEGLHIENDLQEIAKGIKSEEFTNMMKENGVDVTNFYSRENLAAIRKTCDSFIDAYNQELLAAGTAIRNGFIASGVALEDTLRRFMVKPVDAVLALADPKEKLVYPDTFMNNMKKFMDGNRNPASLFAGNKAKLAAKLNANTIKSMLDLYHLLDPLYDLYTTLQLISKQTYKLGIVKEINDGFLAVLKEKNVVDIDETNDILNRIISGTEAPFIYEKLGVRFENFLLDEFQDTSVVQWENFKPLVNESQANGKESLIVGDVKQSIYRWRGSDWNLLAQEVQNSVKQPVNVRTLDTNWRSSKNVITFNNAFFEFAKDCLKKREYIDVKVLDSIYSDVEQKVSPKMEEAGAENDGSVEVTFTNDQMQEIVVSIQKVLDAGGSYSQIAILVRNNDEGSKIAKMLTKKKIPVISDEALLVKASTVVTRLVALLYCLDSDSADGSHKDKKRMVNTYLAEQIAVEIPKHYGSLADLCEGLLRGLHENDPALFDNEVSYIQCFMDELKDWTGNNGNNLKAFLAYWEGANPKLSSPDSSNALTILTVHKAKGLEFEYIIFPFIEKVGLWKSNKAWCIPDFSRVAAPLKTFQLNRPAWDLDLLGKGAYQVSLSKEGSPHTLFADQFSREFFMQTVDNLNIFYVALTRAKKGLHLITDFLGEKNSFVTDYVKSGSLAKANDFGKILYAYIHPAEKGTVEEEAEERLAIEDSPLPDQYKGGEYASVERESYLFGKFYDFSRIKTETSLDGAACTYPSYTLNPEVKEEGEQARERLAFSSDAMDFFGDDGLVGVEASKRIRGKVLHRILSVVETPADLHKAVETVRLQGLMDAGQSEEAEQELKKAISGVRDMHWFPDDGAGIRNETTIYDAQGNSYRPDRLILKEDEAVVVDYKFGDPKTQYRNQVSQYAGLLKDAGYTKVKAYLWYVDKQDGNIEEVVC